MYQGHRSSAELPSTTAHLQTLPCTRATDHLQSCLQRLLISRHCRVPGSPIICRVAFNVCSSQDTAVYQGHRSSAELPSTTAHLKTLPCTRATDHLQSCLQRRLISRHCRVPGPPIICRVGLNISTSCYALGGRIRRFAKLNVIKVKHFHLSYLF